MCCMTDSELEVDFQFTKNHVLTMVSIQDKDEAQFWILTAAAIDWVSESIRSHYLIDVDSATTVLLLVVT